MKYLSRALKIDAKLRRTALHKNHPEAAICKKSDLMSFYRANLLSPKKGLEHN